MSNEIKILSMLENQNAMLEKHGVVLDVLVQGQAKLEAGFAELKGDVSVLKDKVEVLDKKVEILTEDVAVLKDKFEVLDDKVDVLTDEIHFTNVLIENETNRHVRFIAEGHMDIQRRINKVEPLTEKHEEDISVIKAVISCHSDEIKELQAV
jgi:predicted nuclease with TOPRIM domain